MKLNTEKLNSVKGLLKEAFTPPAPMDPAAMGGAPPMDPMAGGMPPMDPAMAPPMDPAMGGMPPMDPAAMGAPPMDPMAGGMPPMDPAMGGMPPMDPAMMDPAMGGLPPPGDPAAAGEGDPLVGAVEQLIDSIDQLDKKVDGLEENVGQVLDSQGIMPAEAAIEETAEVPQEEINPEEEGFTDEVQKMASNQDLYEQKMASQREPLLGMLRAMRKQL